MGVRGNREITDEEIMRGGRWERRDGEEIAIGVRQRSGWRGGGAASGFWGQRHGGGGGVRVRERSERVAHRLGAANQSGARAITRLMEVGGGGSI